MFQKVKYYYDYEEKRQFSVVEFPIHHSFEYYSKWTGYSSDIQIRASTSKYGANRFESCFIICTLIIVGKGWIFLLRTSLLYSQSELLLHFLFFKCFVCCCGALMSTGITASSL